MGKGRALKILVDTHIWIWSQECPEKLGSKAQSAVLRRSNEIFISTASTIEIARLIALDRLSLAMDLASWVEQSLRLLQAATVPITHEVAIEAYRLPEPFHRDPADRLLVGACRVFGLNLLTADERILGYPAAKTIDARV